MRKTLGGDRLGAGKKMQVDIGGYGRSTHDLGYLWRSTMAAGTLVPFMSQVGLPGDTWWINLDADIKTHPTIGPLFGSYKVQLDVFVCPVRLYQKELHNNKLKVGMNMANVKLPLMELEANIFQPEDVPDIDNAQINPSSILAYLGIRGVGINWPASTEPRRFNALSLLSYWDIYKNYYANKQEEIGAVLHTERTLLIQTVDSIQFRANFGFPTTTIPFQGPPDGNTYAATKNGLWTVNYTGLVPQLEQLIVLDTNGNRYSLEELRKGPINATVAGVLEFWFNYEKYGNLNFSEWDYISVNQIEQEPPSVTTFDLDNLDEMREQILEHTANGTAFLINTPNLAPYNLILGQSGGWNNMLSNQEGLALKTYQSDLFNNWLSTEWIDGAGGINEITAIDTSGGDFTIDTLNLSKKIYDLLNKVAVSGGSYNDWQAAVYDTEAIRQAENPMYMGGLTKELVFQEVISNTQTSGDNPQPLGTLAGKGVMASKHKGGQVEIKVKEISYILGIVSLTPRVDYSQGNMWDVHLLTMDDFHKPGLDEIGFQELITEQMAWWSTRREAIDGPWLTRSAGKQPAWVNYMTNTNKTLGNFAISTNEMFMTLNRRYEADPLTGEIVDLTTYIDPMKFNNIFAETSRDAQNFWTQISVDATVRRVMSAKVMPNL